MRNKYINEEKLQLLIAELQQEFHAAQGDPESTLITITLDEAISQLLENNFLHHHEFESFANKRQSESSKTLERMRFTQEACHKAFSYVGDISTITSAKRLLSENRFYDTFRAINDHFMKVGVTGIYN